MVETDFINEQRFLTAYVRGKFSNNKWGRNKINLALRKKHFDNERITEALKKINDIEYRKTAEKLIIRKLEAIEVVNRKEKSKLYYYMLSKGYEPEIVIETINKHTPN